VVLVFSEEFASREEALACERKIKGWSRKKKEALMRGDWAVRYLVLPEKSILRQAQDERITIR
jgi:predicted GIY-YIG superfamily endonuclease